MVLIVGTYELPIAIGVTRACLAKKYRAKVGGRSVLIGFPKVEWDSRPAPFLSAPQVENLPEHRGSGMSLGRSANGGDLDWGSVSQWNANSLKYPGAWVATVSVEFSVPENSFTYSDYLYGLGTPRGGSVDEFFDSVDEWFERLLTWVAILTNQDTYYRDPLSQAASAGERLTVRAIRSNGEKSLPASAYRITISTRTVTLMIEQVLRRSIALANANQVPPDSRLLLRDAEIDLRRQRYRKAVIDAGAAAELVLSTWNNANGVLSPRGQMPTLGNLVRWTSASIPPNTRSDLVLVRNAAIHQNVVPPASVALQALGVARAIVDLLEPLPT
jgi:hypothetical protein